MTSILLISPESWDDHAVSKHHYATTLAAQGYKVFFLEPPKRDIRKVQVRAIRPYPGVVVVSAPLAARGLRFMPRAIRQRFESRWLARLESILGCEIDAIWLFENSRFYDMRFAGERLKIYHQVDLNQDFHPETAAATADICFCTTDFIRDRLLPHNPRVFKIQHGLAQPASPVEPPSSMAAHFTYARPHAVYIGNLDMLYLDADLLADTARRFPAVRFHFVGGYSDGGALRRVAGALPNVVWWGKVESKVIPAILERADVLLVIYKADIYREQLASPHKFMEYFASGKTIVATYTDEYKDKRHLLEMVDASEDYIATFGRVIGDLAEYNSPSRQAERKAFAQAHTYEKQLERIWDLVAAHVPDGQVGHPPLNRDTHVKE